MYVCNHLKEVTRHCLGGFLPIGDGGLGGFLLIVDGGLGRFLLIGDGG